MSPFTIQCTTCDARLSVRKRSALGKIFACPNCGGMVLAERSAEQVRRDDAESQPQRDSRWREARTRPKRATALLDSSYEVVNEILDHPPVSSQVLPDQPSSPAGQHPQEHRSDDANTPNEPATTDAPAVSTTVPGDAEVAPEAPAAPTTRPASGSCPELGARKQKYRAKYMVPALIGAALAFAALRYASVPTFLRGKSAGMSSGEIVALKPVSSDLTLAQRNVVSRMQMPLEGSLPNASLPSFLQFVSHAADVPIALDVDSLRYSRIGLDTQVTTRNSDASVERMLQESLRPLRLVANVREGMVFVTSAVADDDTLRTAQHDIGDLVNGETSAEHLGSLIRDFVSADSWQALGGQGSMQIGGGILTISQTPRVHLDVFVFCDALRLARGLPVRGKQAASTAAETISPPAEQTLASRVDVHCPEPTRLPYALAQIEKAAGCHLLVDWQALRHAGRSFADRVIIHCQGTPLEEVLTRITNQLQLTFRMVGPSAFEITTREAERGAEMIVFHPLVGGEDTMERVLAAMDELGLPPGPGRRFAYEPVSATLAARLPWSLQRRLTGLLP